MIGAEFKRLFHSRYMKWMLICFVIYSICSSFYPFLTKQYTQIQDTVNTVSTWDFSDTNTAKNKAYQLENSDGALRVVSAIEQKEKAVVRKEQLLQMQDSFLFEDAKDQAEIQRELNVIEKMSVDAIHIINDVVVIDICNNQWLDFFVILLIAFYIMYCLVGEDLDSSLLRLFDTTIRSKRTRILSKIIVLMSIVSGCMALKYGMSLLSISLSGVSITYPMHTVLGYDALNLYCSIGMYLLLMYWLKLLCILTVIGIFTIVLLITKNHALALFVNAIILVVEFLISKFVSVTSNLAFLSIYNLWTLASLSKLQDGYFTIHTFSMPLPFVQTIGLIVCVCVVYFISVLLYGKEMRLCKEKSDKKTWRFHSLAFFLNKDFWFNKKGILLYLCIVGYCTVNALQFQATQKQEDIQYNQIRQQYFGTIDDNLLSRIDADIASSEESKQLLNEKLNAWETLTDEDMLQLESIQTQARQYDDLCKVKSEVEQIKESGGTYFYVEQGMELFMNQNGSIGGLVEFVLIMIPVVLMSVAMMSPVYQTKSNPLIFSTKLGKRKYLMKCFLRPLSLGILTYITVFALRYYKLSRFYSITFTNGLTTDIVGVNFPFTFPLYLVLLVVSQMLWIVCMIICCMKLSKYFDRLTTSVLMLIIAIVCIMMPFGPGVLFRYDMMNHLIQYSVCMVFMMIYLSYTICKC